MPLTDADKLANQAATIRVLYEEIDALRSKLETVRAVLASERAKLDKAREVIARVGTSAQIRAAWLQADDDGKAEVMRMPD